jgi:Flp pilus assembly protein TadG
MPARRPTARSRRSAADGRERGTGLIGTWFGFVVFLALLLFAVQVLYDLYSTSVVTGVAFDAARKVAGASGGPTSEAAAEATAREVLGRYGRQVRFTWDLTDPDVVQLRVQADNPAFVLPSLRAGPFPFQHVDRTIRVRVERFR